MMVLPFIMVLSLVLCMTQLLRPLPGFARHLITFWTQYYSAFFSSLAEAEVMHVDPIKPTSVGWLYLQWLGGGRVKGSRDTMR